MKTEKSDNSFAWLCNLTFIVFLILKLAEKGAVQHWSWWWVTSPLWLPLALWLIFVLIAFTITKL